MGRESGAKAGRSWARVAASGKRSPRDWGKPGHSLGMAQGDGVGHGRERLPIRIGAHWPTEASLEAVGIARSGEPERSSVDWEHRQIYLSWFRPGQKACIGKPLSGSYEAGRTPMLLPSTAGLLQFGNLLLP